jgi:glycosyltransferase involved in cell wall biosynthesis
VDRADVRPPRVAICIPTFNQAAFLALSARSALAQGYTGELEIWISDDASTDATPAVIAELCAESDRVRSVRQERNLGIAGNASAALRAPEAEYVVRLDSDDLLEPGYVEYVVDRMERHQKAAYAHTAVQEIDAHGRVLRTRRVARPTGFREADRALRDSLSGYRTAANILTFRKSCLEAVSFYEGRPDFVEDYDLSVRLADAGFGNVYIDEPLARYRVWTDERGMRPRRKGLQLVGYRRIFEESIEPAWSSRGWSLRPVRRRRAKLAALHAPSLFLAGYTREEQGALIEDLLGLSNALRVRLRVRLCRTGLASQLARVNRIPFRVKDMVKAVLSSVRARSDA